MRRYLYKLHDLPARLSLLLVMVLCAGHAMAQSKLYADDFTLVPQEEKAVVVNFDNENGIAALQADFTLPEGIEYKDFKVNEDRIARGIHTATITQQANGVYRILVVPSVLETIGGENGELLTLTLTCNTALTAKQAVMFSNIKFSDISGKQYLQDDFNVNASPKVGNISVGEQQFTIAPGEKHQIAISMENQLPVYGVQGRISLPQGLTIEKNDKGRYAWSYGDRLPQNAAISYNPATGKFALNDMSATQDFGNEGVLFSFNVVADETLTGNAEIVVSDFVVSSTNDVTYGMDDVLTIKVLTGEQPQKPEEANEEQHTADLAVIAEVQARLNEVMRIISGYSQSVQEAMASIEASIQTSIYQLTAAAEASYKAGTSVQDKDALRTAINEVWYRIDRLAVEAEAAEAVEQGREDNEAQHTADLTAIAEVKAQIEAAQATLAGYAESVQEAMAEKLAALQTAAEKLVAKAEASYQAGTSVEDAAALKAGIEALVADIEKFVAEAAAAQQAYEAGLANEAQHQEDLAAIEKVQAELDAAMQVIDGYSETVQQAVAESELAVQASIDALKEKAEASYQAGTSVADREDLLAAIAAVQTQIANLALEAEAAQKGVDANKLQHQKDLEGIAAVQDKLEAVKQAVAGYSETVQQAVAAEVASVQQAIEGLKAMAEASFAAGTSVADKETLQAELAKVQQLVEELSAHVAAVNKSYEDNIAQHEEDLAAISALKDNFDRMKAAVAGYVQEVQDKLAQDVAAVQAAIDQLSAAAEASFKAGTSVQDKETLLAGIAAANEHIDVVLAQAEALWVAYQENEAQYEADLAIVAYVQQKFDNVLAKIAGFDAAVAEAVAEDVENVKKAIERLAATAEKSHNNGTSVEDADLLQTMAYNVESLIAALENKAELEQQKISSGIGEVTVDGRSEVMYDLSGRRVMQAKGVVIVNGQKRIVK
ncbi:MAG: hypothetical protein PUB53_03280 [Bacteroidales bacterium]|nr:hypothetical protein [Bacteroidales bacterium]